MAELSFITTATGIATFALAVLAWFLILAGSCALVLLVYTIREWWSERGR